MKTRIYAAPAVKGLKKMSSGNAASIQHTRYVDLMLVSDWADCVDVRQHQSRTINPLTAKLFNLNFHLLEVASRLK